MISFFQDWLSVSFGWAVGKFSSWYGHDEWLTILSGIGLGVFVSGSISGGHINPAVRLFLHPR